MGRSKTLLTGFSISLAIFALLTGLLVGFDLLVHKRFDRCVSHNCRGYRGKVLGKKRRDEIRVGLFGGSVAMGYGSPNERSIAGFLERFLNAEAAENRMKESFTVVNLGANGESRIAFFMANYLLFEPLDLDILIFYAMNETVEDAMRQRRHCRRSANWAFRRFNYYFVFPTILRERYYIFRYGDMSRGYREDRFFQGIDRLFNLGDGEHAARSEGEGITLRQFVDAEAKKGKTFIFAIAPQVASADGAKREALLEWFALNLSDHPHVVIADLRHVFSEEDLAADLSDGIHYTTRGNLKVARALAGVVPMTGAGR